MDKQKIFIATSTFCGHNNRPIEIIENAGFTYLLNKTGRKLDVNNHIQDLYGVQGIIAGTELYSSNILDQLPNLRVISRLGVGMDNIDLDVACKKGILVFKTNTTPAKAVAELSLGLMIDVQRKISRQFNQLTIGTWNKEMGSLLSGKTLGIIGLGVIGKNLVELVSGFNFNVLAFDLVEDASFKIKHNINYCSLDNLLKRSDIISVHLNLSKYTRNILNKEKLKLMKAESILINTSRGEVVDENALYNLLKESKIKGAGLDVFSKEPYVGRLTKLENVVLTPHIGAYADEIRQQMEMEAVNNVIKGLNN